MPDNPIVRKAVRQEDTLSGNLKDMMTIGKKGNAGEATSARGWTTVQEDAAVALATEPVQRPYADLPVYDEEMNRETILRRYAHIAELTRERHPEYDAYWVCEWATMYALDPTLVQGYQATINMVMLVAALLLSLVMDKQTSTNDPTEWAQDEDLRSPFLYCNGFAVAMYITCILGGTLIFENVTRRPFTAVDAWMILMDHWTVYVIWCQTLTLGIIANLLSFMLEVVGVNEQGAGVFTVVWCSAGGLFTIYVAFSTAGQVGKFQTLRTKQFMQAYVDPETGLLHDKWLQWLQEQHTERHGTRPQLGGARGSLSANASSS
eukprot:g3345.t1